MANVVSQKDFDDFVEEVQDHINEFNGLVDGRVAQILREMAATVDAWPSMSLSEHLNNAANKLEDKE